MKEKYIRYLEDKNKYFVCIRTRKYTLFSKKTDTLEEAIRARNKFLNDKYGNLDALKRKNVPKQIYKNEFYISEDGKFYFGKCSNGIVFKIDLDDYEKVSKYTWGTNGDGYIENPKVGKLHRFLLCPNDGEEIDHINRDMGYNRNRAANGRYTSRGRGRRMGYMPPEMQMPYMEDEFMAEYLDYPEIMGKSGRRMGYGNERSGDTMNGNRGREMGGSREGGSRYGRSYDSYRENRRHYTEMRDEDSKHKMKENIAEIFDDMEDIATEVVKDMTSEEKAKYKQKLQAIMQKMA